MSAVLNATRSAFADAARELRAGWSWTATLWALAFAAALLAAAVAHFKPGRNPNGAAKADEE